MKRFILLILLISSWSYANSQTTHKNTYLVVRLEYVLDKSTEKSFYKIHAEPGNHYAKEVYGLIEYKTDKKAVNSGGIYFSDRADSSTTYYNYFSNTTEVLSFLADNNWELITVFNHISSGYDSKAIRGENYPYTTISSYPVYYFKKTVE